MGLDPRTLRDPESLAPTLRREVAPARRAPPSGGLLLLSSLGTLFALSGALLLLQAQQADRLARQDRALAERWREPPRWQAPPAAAERPKAECGGPSFRATGQGSTEVTFRACTGEAEVPTLQRPAVADPIGAFQPRGDCRVLGEPVAPGQAVRPLCP